MANNPKALKAGDSAPDLGLQDETGTVHRIGDYRGKWLLIYFYPKDNTPGCTVEACTLRDRFGDLRDAGAVVLGVSSDSAKSHQGFVAKHKLPFPLLVDPDGALAFRYGVGKDKLLGIPMPFSSRTSFLVGPDGTIAKLYAKVAPASHAADVLSDIRALSGK